KGRSVGSSHAHIKSGDNRIRRCSTCVYTRGDCVSRSRRRISCSGCGIRSRSYRVGSKRCHLSRSSLSAGLSGTGRLLPCPRHAAAETEDLAQRARYSRHCKYVVLESLEHTIDTSAQHFPLKVLHDLMPEGPELATCQHRISRPITEVGPQLVYIPLSFLEDKTKLVLLVDQGLLFNLEHLQRYHLTAAGLAHQSVKLHLSLHTADDPVS